ncbi:MAG: CpsD/CapB family tyrosine-protein kinase [Bacillota bacterium]|nr:CpsD/CapB family tyrosine-protein kinase [Bacillota bacterium]
MAKKHQDIVQEEIRPTIITEKTSFYAKESYKAARTNLLFLMNKYEKKHIVITSPYMEAGKTTTCINLAITFAQLGSKVLIVDADMRKPMVNKAMGLPLSPGLADRLGGFSEVTNVLESCYKNLFIIPAGTIPPNPTELLSSQSMDILLDELAKDFDYIFVDAPPINVVTDAAILSRKVTGTVLIVRQDTTTKDSLAAAVKAVNQINGNLLGFIMNAVDHDKFSYRYGHYYGRYGSYYTKYSKYGRYGRYGQYGGKYGYFKRYGYTKYGYENKYGYSEYEANAYEDKNENSIPSEPNIENEKASKNTNIEPLDSEIVAIENVTGEEAAENTTPENSNPEKADTLNVSNAGVTLTDEQNEAIIEDSTDSKAEAE